MSSLNQLSPRPASNLFSNVSLESHPEVSNVISEQDDKIKDIKRPNAGRMSLSKVMEARNVITDSTTTRDKTIDEMRIKTMYRMVEDVTLSQNGVEQEKKVLYLTNKQANMFDEEGMARCIQALDLGEPKCIIRL